MKNLTRSAASLVAAVGLCAGVALGQGGAVAAPAAQAPEASATLKIADAAPALSIAKWVKGEPISGLAKGQVYVVEFWATWCGPCLASSPHLTKLQAAHKADGLTIIGVTREDPRNTLAKVEQMMIDRGEVMGYTIAWDDGQKTWDAYMAAAKQRGIPTAFVVDRAGQIVFIGHPMFLDLVLPGVLKGTWDASKDLASVRDAEDAMDAVYGQLSGSKKLPAKDALAAIKAFEAEHPLLAGNFEEDRYLLLAQMGDPAAAVLGRTVVAQGKKDKSFATLMAISDGIVGKDAGIAKPDLDLALEAAEGANALTGGVRTSALASLARVHAAKGNQAKAVEFMTLAVEKAPENVKARFQKELDEMKKTGG